MLIQDMPMYESTFLNTSEGDNASRSLLLVNDHAIRNELLRPTWDLIKKIRKLERDRETFFKEDQDLYTDWFNLTFRDEQLELERLERRSKVLLTFRMHLEYLAKTSKVSLAQAYALLEEEERQYQAGDEEWKFVIEKLREQRLEHARKSLAGSQEDSHNHEPRTSSFFDFFAQGENEKADESVISQVDISGLNRKQRSTYYYLKENSEEVLKRHFDPDKGGYELFREAFHIVMLCKDWHLLSCLWQKASVDFQKKLLKTMPGHLADFLNQMMESAQPEEQREEIATIKEFKVKSLYRKLARLLHPDTLQASLNLELKDWAQKAWQDVQKAYQEKDLDELRRLEFLTLVYLKQLNNLTLDEITAAVDVFSEELTRVQQSLKDYRKHPAWKFSSRRGYSALTLIIRRKFKLRMQPLAHQVQDLEDSITVLRKALSAEPIEKPGNISV